MSDAAIHIQTAAIDALRDSVPVMAAVSGVFDGPPPRAAFPYVTVSDGLVTDWGTKTLPGREVRLSLTIWDDGDSPARLYTLMHQSEDAVACMARDLGGWRVASVVFLRSLVARDPAGPWAGLVEHRVRVMATD